MLVTHKASYTFQAVSGNDNQIDSSCSSITFDNAGDVDLKIVAPGGDLTANYYLLKAGKSVDFGGRLDALLTDSYNIQFVSGQTGVTLLNVIRETYQLLS